LQAEHPQILQHPFDTRDINDSKKGDEMGMAAKGKAKINPDTLFCPFFLKPKQSETHQNKVEQTKTR